MKDKYPALADMLKKCVMDVCEKTLPFIRRECREAPGIPSVDANLVASFLRMLSALVSERHGFKPETDKEREQSEPESPKTATEKSKAGSAEKALARLHCAFAAVWSLGANLHEDSRRKFEDHLKGVLQPFCPEASAKSLYAVYVDDENSALVDVSSRVPLSIYLSLYLSLSLSFYLSLSLSLYIYIYMHISLSLYIYTYIHIISLSLYIYIYIYLYNYIYTYIYIYT